jgi:hypothetical protein
MSKPQDNRQINNQSMFLKNDGTAVARADPDMRRRNSPT